MDLTNINTVVGLVGAIIGVIGIVVTVTSFVRKKTITISTKTKLYVNPGDKNYKDKRRYKRRFVR